MQSFSPQALVHQQRNLSHPTFSMSFPSPVSFFSAPKKKEGASHAYSCNIITTQTEAT